MMTTVILFDPINIIWHILRTFLSKGCQLKQATGIIFFTLKYWDGEPVCLQTPISSAKTSFLVGNLDWSTINVAFLLTESGCFEQIHGAMKFLSKSKWRIISIDDKLFIPVRHIGNPSSPKKQLGLLLSLVSSSL